MLEGGQWRIYTARDGLPSNRTYGLTVDGNNIWVGTYDGIAKFDGNAWSVPFSMQNRTIFYPSVHAIAFDNRRNIWIGHIDKGVSQYNSGEGKWIFHTPETSGLCGGRVQVFLFIN